LKRLWLLETHRYEQSSAFRRNKKWPSLSELATPGVNVLLTRCQDLVLVGEYLLLVCEYLFLIREDLFKRFLVAFNARLIVENGLLVIQNCGLIMQDGLLIRENFLIRHCL
jgi:hypothetical protein